MEIPIELFLGGIAVSIAIGIFGFIRNPQIPAMLCFGGAFVLLLSVSTTAILMDAFSSGTTNNLYSYNVESRTGVGSLTNANFAIAEFVSASNSALVGDKINCIGLFLSQTGNPIGTATIGILDSSNPPVALTTFGTINVATLTNAGTLKTFCLSGDNTYTIENQDRIGITYNGAGVGQTVDLQVDANNPFDGTITFRQFYAGGTWNSLTGQDYMGVMYLSGGDFEITQDPYEFTELPKTFFALIGGTMILLGALMVIKE